MKHSETQQFDFGLTLLCWFVAFPVFSPPARWLMTIMWEPVRPFSTIAIAGLRLQCASPPPLLPLLPLPSNCPWVSQRLVHNVSFDSQRAGVNNMRKAFSGLPGRRPISIHVAGVLATWQRIACTLRHGTVWLVQKQRHTSLLWR